MYLPFFAGYIHRIYKKGRRKEDKGKVVLSFMT
jgi:hypothetical protein